MKYGMKKSVALGAIRSAKYQNSIVYTVGGARARAKKCNFSLKRVANGRYTPLAKLKR